MHQKLLATIAALTIHTVAVWAQGTIADYRRAAHLHDRYVGKMRNGNVHVHPIKDSHRFWYSVYDGNKERFKEIDADKNSITELISAYELDAVVLFHEFKTNEIQKPFEPFLEWIREL